MQKHEGEDRGRGEDVEVLFGRNQEGEDQERIGACWMSGGGAVRVWTWPGGREGEEDRAGGGGGRGVETPEEESWKENRHRLWTSWNRTSAMEMRNEETVKPDSQFEQRGCKGQSAGSGSTWEQPPPPPPPPQPR